MVDDRDLIATTLSRCRARLADLSTLAHQAPYIVRAEAWAAHADGETEHAQHLLLVAAQELAASPVHSGAR